jgi:DNA-binding NarL/FixJ family response regulator
MTLPIFKHRGPVLVVDDDAACRELISVILSDAGYDTHPVATVKQALQLAQEIRPAAVVSDVVLPEQSGYELCRSLRETFGETVPIILVSGRRTEPLDSVVALLLGADDYITKPFDVDEIQARVERAIARARAAAPPADETGRDLTVRECQVLRLLAAGLSQKKIADRLVISPKTVATHIQRILTKLGVHSRVEAVAFAYRTGVLNGTAIDDTPSTRAGSVE